MNTNEQNIQSAGQSQPQQPATQAAAPEIPTYRRTIGGTTYIVRVHFSETSREALADKVKRLMVEDVKACHSPNAHERKEAQPWQADD